jgi:Flp pilus assembly protein CpaB
MYMHLIVSVLALATALCSAVAAYYWRLASRPQGDVVEPPDAAIEDNPAMHILVAHVNTDLLGTALLESSRLNKIAATWSALAAAFATVAALLSAF